MSVWAYKSGLWSRSQDSESGTRAYFEESEEKYFEESRVGVGRKKLRVGSRSQKKNNSGVRSRGEKSF